jgi:CspA family cold shock protein
MSKTESTSNQKTDQQKTDQTQDKADRYQGSVKWFSEKRGYGFVQVGEEEVFIHRSTLIAFGVQKIQNEDIVTVSLVDSDRGKIVEKLYGVERPPIPEELMADTPEEGEVMAKVKFFNNHKGYGFIIAENEQQDIFVHFRVLETNGFSTLEQGQRVLVRLEDGDRGKQVSTIRLYTGDDFPASLEVSADEAKIIDHDD